MVWRGLHDVVVVVPGTGGSVLRGDWGDAMRGNTRPRVVRLLSPERLDPRQASLLYPTTLTALAGYIRPYQLLGYDGLVHDLRNGPGVGGTAACVATAEDYRRDLDSDVMLFRYGFRCALPWTADHMAAATDLVPAAVPPHASCAAMVFGCDWISARAGGPNHVAHGAHRSRLQSGTARVWAALASCPRVNWGNPHDAHH
jgi:hypothetical protein